MLEYSLKNIIWPILGSWDTLNIQGYSTSKSSFLVRNMFNRKAQGDRCKLYSFKNYNNNK